MSGAEFWRSSGRDELCESESKPNRRWELSVELRIGAASSVQSSDVNAPSLVQGVVTSGAEFWRGSCRDELCCARVNQSEIGDGRLSAELRIEAAIL